MQHLARFGRRAITTEETLNAAGSWMKGWPQRWSQAKGEWALVAPKLQNPGAQVGGDIIQFTKVAAEIAGLFFVGEVIGRGSLIGYDVGPAGRNRKD